MTQKRSNTGRFLLYLTFGFYSAIIVIPYPLKNKNMYTSVNERIAVRVYFDTHTIIPLAFKWGNRWYEQLKTNVIFPAKKGAQLFTYFSLDDGVNYFKLMLNNQTLEWTLVETGIT